MKFEEKHARKLGEVLAFAQVGIETIKNGQKALSEILGDEEVDLAIVENEKHITQINELASELGVSDAVNTKAEATGTKLRSMRDLYLQDEWDDAIEIFEWLGFFQGAAVVHWSLVFGIATFYDHTALHKLSSDVEEYHLRVFDMVREQLNNVGRGNKK